MCAVVNNELGGTVPNKNNAMKTRTSIILLSLVASTTILRADPQIYFGEDISPWPVTGLNNVPKPTNLIHTYQAASQFYVRLPGVYTETFESYSKGFRPTTLAFGTNIATLTGNYSPIFSYDSTNGAVYGGFAFSGTNVIGLDGTSGQFFTLTFSAPQGAFGFFGCDVEVNVLRLTLVYPDGRRRDIPVPVTTPQGSGGAFFFGVIDQTDPFTSIQFNNIGGRDDGFVFDDMTIAAPEQVRSAPAVLSVGLYAGIDIQGTVGTTYRVEYTPILPTTNWTVLTNVVLPASPYFYLDRDSVTNAGQRYYRAVAQ